MVELIQIISVTALITTVVLMFCGVPICLQIRRQKRVGDVSGFPFIMALLVAVFYFQYGLLRGDTTIIILNVAGFIINLCYASFFLYYSSPKFGYCFQLFIVALLILGMEIWVHLKPDVVMLGIVATAFGILNFGAPLAGLSAVIRRREVSTLPFLLILFSLLVTTQWLLYGILEDDIFICIPSGFGAALSLIQLSLFVVFPKNAEEKSPLKKLTDWMGRRQSTDLQKSNLNL